MSVLNSENQTVNPTNPLESDLNGIEGAVDREFKVRMAMWSAVEAGKIYDSKKRKEERIVMELKEEGEEVVDEEKNCLGRLGLTDSLEPPIEEVEVGGNDGDERFVKFINKLNLFT